MATEENGPARPAADLVQFVDGRRPGIGVRSLAVDGQGRLARKADGTRLEFTFEFLGFLFAVRMESNDHSGHMRFHADLGNLPYSAESLAKRADALAIVAAAGRALGGRVQTTREQRILLFEEMRFEEPLTPVVLMSSTVRLLLEAQPFLELLAQVVEPPVAAGHANLQEN
ncbi:MAG: hypothetical protein IIC54_06010 [Proteobacteria bacterium]|nr:hypothetical protein [Pseudomonadota bacterium]